MSTLTLTPEQLAALLGGASFDLDLSGVNGSQVTLAPPEKRAARRIQSLDALREQVMNPVDFQVEFTPGQLLSFLIRPVDSVRAKECDDLGSVTPPKKTKPGVGRQPATEEYDWSDPKFIEASAKLSDLKKAFILTHGLIDFDLPGETMEAKAQALRAALPPRVVDALYGAILKLTSDPVKVADFS